MLRKTTVGIIKDPNPIYHSGQRIKIDLKKASNGQFKEMVTDAMYPLLGGLNGVIKNSYIVNPSAFVPTKYYGEKFVSAVFDGGKGVFESDAVDVGTDENGDVLIHESFFSLIDEQKQAVVESSQQKKKDWRDCWYGRYGYPDE